MNDTVSISLPMVVPEREPLTMAEARRIGHAATRHSQLTDILGHASGGATFTVKTKASIASPYGSAGTATFQLTSLEAEALIGLLLDREAQFLGSMGVDVRTPL